MEEPAELRHPILRPTMVVLSVCVINLITTVALELLKFSHLYWQNIVLETVTITIIWGVLAHLLVITPMRVKQRDIEYLSGIDPLTGLYDRRRFAILAEQQLKHCQRLNERINIFFIDLDNLKAVNDTHGHEEGDKQLKATAQVLRSCFRQEDVIARIGGDEFLVLTTSPHVDVGRIDEHINNYNRENPSPVNLSVSIGTVEYDPENHYCIHELIAQADREMYKSKKIKKENNSVEFIQDTI